MGLWEAFVAGTASDRAGLLDGMTSAELGEAIVAMTVAERRSAMSKLTSAELAAVLAKVSHHVLVAIGRQGVAALGTYRSRLSKRERVRGKMSDEQTIELVLRTEPFAFLLRFESGPSAGRRVLYNSEIRRSEVRIKEAGALGWAGALWLDLDNTLTRVDTNHRATEIGFSALLDLIEGDLKEAEVKGARHLRRDEGIDGSGTYHSVFTAPPGALSLYAVSTRVGFDPIASLPTFVEVHDTLGHLETYRYSSIESVNVDDDFFTLRGAKL